MATFWQEDASAPACTRCRKAFSVFRRRHHCRMCGFVVCGRCSGHRLPIAHQTRDAVRMQRVCEQCFETGCSQLRAAQASGSLNSITPISPTTSGTPISPTGGESIFSGGVQDLTYTHKGVEYTHRWPPLNATQALSAIQSGMNKVNCDGTLQSLEDIVKVCGAAVGAHNLESLGLACNGMTDDQLAPVLAVIRGVRHLVWLGLFGNNITDDGAEVIYQACLENPVLMWVNLRGNEVSAPVMDRFAELFRQRRERPVVLTRSDSSMTSTNNTLTMTGTSTTSFSLMQHFSKPATRYEYNGEWWVHSSSILPIPVRQAALAVMHGINKVNCDNQLTDPSDLVELCSAISNSSTIQCLGLAHNLLNDEGAELLANAIAANSSLQWLGLFGNHITDSGARSLLRAIRGHPSLQSINVRRNMVSTQLLADLQKETEANMARRSRDALQTKGEQERTFGVPMIMVLQSLVRLGRLSQFWRHIFSNMKGGYGTVTVALPDPDWVETKHAHSGTVGSARRCETQRFSVDTHVNDTGVFRLHVTQQEKGEQSGRAPEEVVLWLSSTPAQLGDDEQPDTPIVTQMDELEMAAITVELRPMERCSLFVVRVRGVSVELYGSLVVSLIPAKRSRGTSSGSSAHLHRSRSSPTDPIDGSGVPWYSSWLMVAAQHYVQPQTHQAQQQYNYSFIDPSIMKGLTGTAEYCFVMPESDLSTAQCPTAVWVRLCLARGKVVPVVRKHEGNFASLALERPTGEAMGGVSLGGPALEVCVREAMVPVDSRLQNSRQGAVAVDLSFINVPGTLAREHLASPLFKSIAKAAEPTPVDVLSLPLRSPSSPTSTAPTVSCSNFTIPKMSAEVLFRTADGECWVKYEPEVPPESVDCASVLWWVSCVRMRNGEYRCGVGRHRYPEDSALLKWCKAQLAWQQGEADMAVMYWDTLEVPQFRAACQLLPRWSTCLLPQWKDWKAQASLLPGNDGRMCRLAVQGVVCNLTREVLSMIAFTCADPSYSIQWDPEDDAQDDIENSILSTGEGNQAIKKGAVLLYGASTILNISGSLPTPTSGQSVSMSVCIEVRLVGDVIATHTLKFLPLHDEDEEVSENEEGDENANEAEGTTDGPDGVSVLRVSFPYRSLINGSEASNQLSDAESLDTSDDFSGESTMGNGMTFFGGGVPGKSITESFLQLPATLPTFDPNRWQVAKASQPLGRGATGMVVKGLDKSTGKVVAIKKCSPASDEEMRGIMREMKILARLKHPNVVQYLGCSRDRATGEVMIVMECAAGGSLATISENFGARDEEDLRRWAMDILQGLFYLHNEGVVHRDIKPGNVLLGEDGRCKVADFGSAHTLWRTMTTNTNTKANGGGPGTPAFMAPEAVRLGATASADVWAFGLTIVQLAIGEGLWRHLSDGVRDSPFSFMYHLDQLRSNETWEYPLPPTMSDDLRDFIRCCVRVRPDARWTCEALMGHPWIIEKPPSMPAA